MDSLWDVWRGMGRATGILRGAGHEAGRWGGATGIPRGAGHGAGCWAGRQGFPVGRGHRAGYRAGWWRFPLEQETGWFYGENCRLHVLLFIAAPLFQQFSLATARPLMASSNGEKFSSMKYHKGHLLTGNITVNLIWCGTHGSAAAAPVVKSKGSKIYKYAYIWVGNSETQCPGQCAWPFHQPMYGPQSAPLVAPNGNVGMDGMAINLALLLAGTATNPFGNGYYQGPAEAPLEAASACAGIYGRGAYPGYAGELLKDESSGGSFNAYGINGRKYLLPALFNPKTSSCEALV
ncbi:hypothetical protein Sjap_021881 [Stephania japonica]|uniref:Uncharacterized protein n=1 Tax=Stephania japonica TaxID=461633 RepID=A0AAP0EWL6_9MAGN